MCSFGYLPMFVQSDFDVIIFLAIVHAGYWKTPDDASSEQTEWCTQFLDRFNTHLSGGSPAAQE